MPYIRKLPSGKFQATVRHPSGRRLTKTDRLRGTVKAWAEQTEAAFRNGTPTVTDRRTTVQQWHDRWIEARNVDATTARKDASRLRTHVLPHWGGWPLASIGRIDVQKWVTGMTKAGVGADTVVGCYHLLSAMLSAAVLEKLIGASPCLEIELPRVTGPEPRWFTKGEYERIQLALATRTLRVPRTGREVPDPQASMWQAFVALGCHSGLRPGELAGLDVPAVHFGRRLVRVSQVVTRAGLRPYGKSATSTRWVPFPVEVGKLLWPLIADRTGGPVFTSPAGARVNESNFRNRVWGPALRAAGIPHERPYVMRHTCASWLVQDGVPDREIMKILGHSSTRLVQVYAHLAPDQHDRIRQAWGEAPDARATHGAAATHAAGDESAGQSWWAILGSNQ